MTCVTFSPRMDRRSTTAAAICWTLLVATGLGCSDLREPGGDSDRIALWSRVTLPNTPRDTAFDAGLYAVRQWFPQPPQATREEGLIRTAAIEYQQEGGTGRIRDAAIGFSNRMRRTATLVIQGQGDGSIARCEVRVQRLDTADHRVFRRNEQFGDVPSETPIDRSAGVSPRQDQVWTDMPRDRQLERRILDLLHRHATGEAAD